MDNYRGNFIDGHEDGEAFAAFGQAEDDATSEPPPSPVGQDERRMQVRAYNHWASLLDNRNFPSIEDLDPEALPDFGPYSVLLDFTGGIENPSIQFLGDKLADECGAQAEIEALADVPSRSLLSRITDHYMQILANQAPIGFEAEFVNQRERTILYRGILLPFSSDDDTIDFIYGVINWKELADQQTTDELLEQIDCVLDVGANARRSDPLAEWADGPAGAEEIETAAAPQADDDHNDVLDLDDEDAVDNQDVLDLEIEADDDDDDVLDLEDEAAVDEEDELGDEAEDDDVLDLLDPEAGEIMLPEPLFTANPAHRRAPLDLSSLALAQPQVSPEEPEAAADFAADQDGRTMELADWLASARELAEAARGADDRTRQALYAAVGRAYDFALAAFVEPEEFAELVADAGLTAQDRAPMTPVVKLVFGGDYDKTRLTEFASALSHAQRLGLARGTLAGHLAAAPGGLKGVVAEERRRKREESGKPVNLRDAPREALARKLRKLAHFPLEAVPAAGNEFTLLVARRLPGGELVMLGEVADDVALLERAARKILG